MRIFTTKDAKSAKDEKRRVLDRINRMEGGV
jgi:hypothetical protein